MSKAGRFTIWTILDRIFDAYRERIGVRPYAQIGFMPKDLRSGRSRIRTTGRGGKYDEIYTVGHIRQGHTRNGRNWFSSGCGTASNVTGRRKWSNGIGRSGTTNRSSAIGAGRGRSSSAARLRIDAVRRALPTARWAAGRAGSGGRLARRSSSTACGARTFATGQSEPRWTLSPFTRRVRQSTPTITWRMGIAAQLRTVDDGFRIIAVSRNSRTSRGHR